MKYVLNHKSIQQCQEKFILLTICSVTIEYNDQNHSLAGFFSTVNLINQWDILCDVEINIH